MTVGNLREGKSGRAASALSISRDTGTPPATVHNRPVPPMSMHLSAKRREIPCPQNRPAASIGRGLPYGMGDSRTAGLFQPSEISWSRRDEGEAIRNRPRCPSFPSRRSGRVLVRHAAFLGGRLAALRRSGLGERALRFGREPAGRGGSSPGRLDPPSFRCQSCASACSPHRRGKRMPVRRGRERSRNELHAHGRVVGAMTALFMVVGPCWRTTGMMIALCLRGRRQPLRLLEFRPDGACRRRCARGRPNLCARPRRRCRHGRAARRPSHAAGLCRRKSATQRLRCNGPRSRPCRHRRQFGLTSMLTREEASACSRMKWRM